MKYILVFLVVSVISLSLARAQTFGIDVSTPIDLKTASCLLSKNLTYAVVRAWRSLNSPDSNAPQSIANLRQAGFTEIAVYMFPCSKCGDAAGQMTKLIEFLSQNKVQYNRIWLDIEGAGKYWGSDLKSNAAFVSALVATAQSHGVSLGVYCGWFDYPYIVGADYTATSNLPLWYAHYDKEPSFGDFKPFNGWTKPYAKQYQGDVTICGADIDFNYRPYAI